MSVLRGDLAPSRSRRRPIGTLLGVLAVVVLLVVAGGGYYLLSSPGDGAKPGAPCGSVAPSPRSGLVLRPGAVHLRVLNGTGRTGLAKSTGALLHARGFAVDAVGNSAPARGAPVLRYGAGGRPAAELVALQLTSAALVSDPRVRGGVEVVLGSGFTRLRTPAEVTAATAAAAKARNARAARPTPTCR